MHTANHADGSRRGERWFIAAAVFEVLFGAGHLNGVLYDRFLAPADERVAAMESVMRGVQLDLMGMHPTKLGIATLFTFSFSALVAAMGVLNLVALRHAADRAALVRSMAIVNLAAIGVVFGLSVANRVPQGIVSGGLIVAVFGVAWIRSRGATGV